MEHGDVKHPQNQVECDEMAAEGKEICCCQCRDKGICMMETDKYCED